MMPPELANELDRFVREQEADRFAPWSWEKFSPEDRRKFLAELHDLSREGSGRSHPDVDSDVAGAIDDGGLDTLANEPVFDNLPIILGLYIRLALNHRLPRFKIDLMLERIRLARGELGLPVI